MVVAAHAAARQLTELAGDGLPTTVFGEAALAAIGRVVPCDGYALIGLDPTTGLRSFMFSRGGCGPSQQLADNEFSQPDVHRYRDLATLPVPAGVMTADDELGSRSPRMRLLLRPAGIGSELRLVARDARVSWAVLTLFRSESARPFATKDAYAAAGLSLPLADALRRFAVRRSAPAQDTRAPGSAVFGAGGQLVDATASFRGWLDELCAGGPFDDVTAEDVLRIVFDATEAAKSSGRPTSVTIRTMLGRWATLHAEALEGDDTHVAVTVTEATAAQVLPSFGRWHGLTSREHEVVALLVRGEVTKGIARTLGISRYTAEDHLRSVYRKTGACGREDLLAALSCG